MFNSNKVKDELKILPNSIGEGSFGFVHQCIIDGKKYAIKCEDKNNENLSLLKEFKMCRKIFNVQRYLNGDNEDNISVQIYKYIVSNNILTIPNALDINYLKYNNIIPEIKTYYECNEYNLLTMELCGKNFEKILEEYHLTEKCKYYIAFHLLLIMSCFHRCGIIHRDMKLANLVLNDEIDSGNELKIVLIDMGLAKEYYTVENDKVVKVNFKKASNITGTIRYLSLNVHEYNSPTIVDDLIGMVYMLINIFTEKDLPWVGYKKDEKKFDRTKHTSKNCKCKYHEYTAKGYMRNTISEVKYHTSINKLCGGYEFLKQWLIYLYSLDIGQMPSYNIMTNIILNDKNFPSDLKLEFIKK
jgi:serine/threonine protein kinase